MTTTATTAPRPGEEPAVPLSREGGRGDFAVVRELLPYLRPYVARIVLSLGLILASKVATLFVPIAQGDRRSARP